MRDILDSMIRGHGRHFNKGGNVRKGGKGARRPIPSYTIVYSIYVLGVLFFILFYLTLLCTLDFHIIQKLFYLIYVILILF